MIKMTLEIEGMACGMCEAHINDVIRRSFKVKTVSSSHKDGRTEIIADRPIDDDRLREVIAETGYRVTSVCFQPYEKKRFSLFHRK